MMPQKLEKSPVIFFSLPNEDYGELKLAKTLNKSTKKPRTCPSTSVKVSTPNSKSNLLDPHPDSNSAEDLYCELSNCRLSNRRERARKCGNEKKRRIKAVGSQDNTQLSSHVNSQDINPHISKSEDKVHSSQLDSTPTEQTSQQSAPTEHDNHGQKRLPQVSKDSSPQAYELGLKYHPSTPEANDGPKFKDKLPSNTR